MPKQIPSILPGLLNCIRFCRGLEPIPLEPQIVPLDGDAMGTLEVRLESGIDLPSADANGLSDPYCKVTANGKTQSTKVKYKTLNPDWFEVFECKQPATRTRTDSLPALLA